MAYIGTAPKDIIDVTQNNSITAAFTAANTPSHVANSAAIYANGAFTAANAATTTNITQNNSIIAAFTAANTPSHVANSAAIYANGAFAAANAATTTNITQNNSITAAFTAANTPSHVANSAAIYANGAFAAANAASGAAAFNTANAAFIAANTASATNTTQNNSITVALNTANAAFTTANNANANGSITAAKLDIKSANGVGAVILPAGTTAQRPSGTSGSIRYNTTTGQFEGYTSSAWGSIGGGATGGGNDTVFFLNANTVTANYTISTGYNALSAGPITINANVTVNISNGANWVVV